MESARVVVLGVVAMAAVSDLRTCRIPNFLTFGAAAIGLLFHAWTGHGAGVLFSLEGVGVGLALFLPLYLLGGMGAGDVKLSAAVGAWLGPLGVLWAALFSALAGGVLALLIGTISGYTPQALRNVWEILGVWRATGIQPVAGMTLAESRGPRVPYGVAIAAGTFAAVWFK